MAHSYLVLVSSIANDAHMHTTQYRHPILEESLQRYFGDNATPSHLKMADVPGDDTTRLIPCSNGDAAPGPFPLVAVRNVFVLPGASGSGGWKEGL